MLGATPPLPSVPIDPSSGKFAQSAFPPRLAAHSVLPLKPAVLDSTSTVREGGGFLGEDEVAFESRGLGNVTSSPKVAQQGSQSVQKDTVSLTTPRGGQGESPGRGRRIAGGSQALRCDVLGCVSPIFIVSAWFCRDVSETCSFTILPMFSRWLFFLFWLLVVDFMNEVNEFEFSISYCVFQQS